MNRYLIEQSAALALALAVGGWYAATLHDHHVPTGTLVAVGLVIAWLVRHALLTLAARLVPVSPQEQQAIAELRAADAALHANQAAEMAAGIDWETEEFHRLNDAANAAADRVSVRHGGTRRQ
ncbi:hypothetical protein [Streptomyces sp. NPDC006784]|uniref:hypothetical protein n=1 Tax=Streptomyces sp. NPDC006784 TaxID=3364764 RepID=UPI003696070E